MKKSVVIFFTGVFALIVLIFFVFFSFKDEKLHIVVCDVGQGDAILIITPKQAQILVDGGPDKAILDCLSRHMAFWDRSIEAVVMTHPHADHMFGLVDVIERYKLSSFYTEDVKPDSDGFKILEAKLASEKLSAKDLSTGDILKDKSGVKIEILWPRLGEAEKVDHNTADLDLNGLSVVALISYGNFSMLLTGDAGENVMNIVKNEVGDIDVLKVPHHGSRTGLSASTLSVLKPEVSVISVGSENKYGHPAKEIIDLLENNNSKILRTDKDGEVEIISDGNSYSVKSSN